jgi:hypothetical protein
MKILKFSLLALLGLIALKFALKLLFFISAIAHMIFWGAIIFLIVAIVMKLFKSDKKLA